MTTKWIWSLTWLVTVVVPAGAITLSEAVEAALVRAPDVPAIIADRATQEARRDASNRLFPGTPYVQLDSTTDRFTTRRGFTTFGAEIGTPLWLPGEGRAAGRQASAGIAETDARLLALRLAVAGTVRDAVGQVEEAALAVPPQQRRAAAARQLGALVEQRARRGESPQADALLARSEGLLAEAAVQDQLALRAQALELSGRVSDAEAARRQAQALNPHVFEPATALVWFSHG